MLFIDTNGETGETWRLFFEIGLHSADTFLIVLAQLGVDCVFWRYQPIAVRLIFDIADVVVEVLKEYVTKIAIFFGAIFAKTLTLLVKILSLHASIHSEN